MVLFQNDPQQWSGAREFDCLPLDPGSSVPGLVTLDILLNLSGLQFPLCRLGVSNCTCSVSLGIPTVWHSEPSHGCPPHWSIHPPAHTSLQYRFPLRPHLI